MSSLINKLKEYKQKGITPLHMPGGKREPELLRLGDPFSFDITEIEGFDNLHNAEGILKNEMKRAADIYRADLSLFCVNGSTSGLLAAVCGATKKNAKVLVARNSHICIINALILRELFPVFLYPETDESGIYKGLSLDDIKKGVEENPDAEAVIITSPTYEGVVSKVKEIADFLHSKGKLLIVDEAHGAHFPFSDAFPASASALGADAVVNSTHKTLPALTQTALLHLNGDIIDKDKVSFFWNMMQTTSPSYVLMGSISACFDLLLSDEGKKRMNVYVNELLELRKRLDAELEHLRLFKSDDISKIVILAKDGKVLYDKLLSEHKIQLEMAGEHYVTAMTSVADRKEYYDKFFEALKGLDKSDFYLGAGIARTSCGSDTNVVSKDSTTVGAGIARTGSTRKTVLPPFESVERSFTEGRLVSLNEATGQIAAETIVIYPPGTPLIVPGEEITPADTAQLQKAINKGFTILGLHDGNCNVKVI